MSVVNCNKEKFDVYIGRPSKWGNPFMIGVHGTRTDVISKYEEWIQTKPELLRAAKEELKGKVLGCHCKPAACHGDVLERIANESSSHWLLES